MTPYYEAGGVTIYLGDCMEVLPALTLPAMVPAHVITDPPYARDVYTRIGASNRTMGLATSFSLNNGARLSKLAAGAIGWVDDLVEPVSREFARLATRWTLVFSDVELCHLWRAAIEAVGMRYVRTGAWVKTDPMPQFTGDRPAVGFEPCTIGHAQGPMRWNGGGRPALWKHGTAKGAERPEHPCPKPLPLMRELVAQFTDLGDIVLDPFCGSGTTLRAAKDFGRRAIGIEIEERWAEESARRLSQEVLL